MQKLALSLSLALGLGVALSGNVAVADSVRDVLVEYGLAGVLDGFPDALEIDLDALTIESGLDPLNVGDLRIVTEDRVLIRININSRKCIGYLREHTDNDSVVPVGERIEESDAIRIAVKLLTDADVDYAPETLVTQSSFRGDPSPEDLLTAHYTIRVRRTYQGYPARSGASVVVDVLGGRIRMFRDLPLVPPDSMTRRVDEKEALQIAIGWAESSEVSVIGTPTASLELVYPNNMRNMGSSGKYQRGAKMKLCWIVKILPSSRPSGPSMLLYVDAADGTIVGGF